nr:Chain B, Calcyclin-binding protein peptide [synthetic construct]
EKPAAVVAPITTG